MSTFIISLSVVWHQSKAGMNYIESFTAFFHHCWTNIHDNRLHSIGSFVNMTVVNASLVSTKAPQSLLFFIINWSLNEIKESLQVMDWTVWWSLLYAPKSMLILRETSYAPLWYQSWKREINFFKVWKSISGRCFSLCSLKTSEQAIKSKVCVVITNKSSSFLISFLNIPLFWRSYCYRKTSVALNCPWSKTPVSSVKKNFEWIHLDHFCSVS